MTTSRKIEPAPDTDRQRELTRHQSGIRSCTACVDAGCIQRAMPIFQGHAGHRVMIVGQAPAYRTVETPPYSGASGKKLQVWLEQAGFPPGSLYERFYLTSLTKCFPGTGKNGNGDRPPSAAEVALCAPHFAGELRLVQPELIITLGRMAAARFLGNRRLIDMVGQEFQLDGVTVVPLPHPSGVSRWLNDAAHQRLVARAIETISCIRVDRNL